MGIFDWSGKEEAKIFTEATVKAAPTAPAGDVVERPGIEMGIKKGYVSQYLYKPPFGYPRPDNVLLLRNLSKNAYVNAVITALQEEAAYADWDVVPADDTVVMTESHDKLRQEIKQFLINPNDNKETYSDIIKKAVRDICIVDGGVWNKIFDRTGKLQQLVALDGGSILLNPNIHGSIGGRADIIFPDNLDQINEGYASAYANNSENTELFRNQYSLQYNEVAAYYQYGWTPAALPVPFGKREIVYMKKNQRSDNIYGLSPIAILGDILLTLVYGSQYNLDFYKNSNMPEGIISLPEADSDQIKSFSERLKNTIQEEDPVTGFNRKVGFKMPVMNSSANFIPFQIGSREMQIIEQQQWFSRMVWMQFGLSESDMGINDDSNRATSQSDFKKYARKAVRPILKLIEQRINQEIIPEFGTNELMFQYDSYDIDEDKRKHELYQMQINMGIKTPEMVAEELNIDIQKLKESKETAREEVIDNQEDKKPEDFENDKTKSKESEDEPSVKAKYNMPDKDFDSTELEKGLVSQLKILGKQVKDAIAASGVGSDDRIV